ncbi:MAG: hypothetical protein QOJ84_568 [Bradyrhizobium sp.]|nr:hypothetical protein [Bradyrhizobium sp.]
MSQKLARAFVSEAISNSHAGIKACWLIVFSAGTYAALSTMKDVLIQMGQFHGTVSADKQITQHPFICFVLFAVFVITFLRFYIGGVRVFDIRYSEIFKLINAESNDSNDMAGFKGFVDNSDTFKLVSAAPHDSKEIADFKVLLANSAVFKLENTQSLENSNIKRFKELVANSDKNIYKYEVVILTFQTLIVVFLAFQIGDWLNFAEVYAFLLTWNVIYLIFNYSRSKAVLKKMFEDIFSDAAKGPAVSAMFPMRASLIWILNNTVCVLALSAIFYFCLPSVSNFHGALVCVCVSLNCIADFFIFARDFYFPRFGEFLEVTMPSSS